MIPCQPQAEDLGEEVGRGMSVGWGSGLKDEVLHAEEPKTRWRGGRQYQKARLEVLPAEDVGIASRRSGVARRRKRHSSNADGSNAIAMAMAATRGATP